MILKKLKNISAEDVKKYVGDKYFPIVYTMLKLNYSAAEAEYEKGNEADFQRAWGKARQKITDSL